MALDASLDIIRREDFISSGDDGGGNVSFASAAAVETADADKTPKFPDYANAPPPPEGTESKFRGGITTHFPALLHAMLTKAESDGYCEICCWKPHGRAFTVFNRERFVREVMPRYFRQSQFASFQRQLNLYGFHRLSQKSSDSAGAYYHAMFLRTRQDLCPAIQRATEKELRERNKEKRGSSLPDPDFSRMRSMPQANKLHIETASNITIPQRKCSTSLQPAAVGSKPAEPAVAAHALAPPPGGEPDMFASKALASEDLAVDTVYASLFALDGAAKPAPKQPDYSDGEEFDLSWMEPRPIAPEAVPALSGSQHLATNDNLDDASSFRWLDPLALNSNAAPSNAARKKRSRPASAAAGSQSSEDPTMASFLCDIDLDLSDGEDPFAPPQKTQKTGARIQQPPLPRDAAGPPPTLCASSSTVEPMRVHVPLPHPVRAALPQHNPIPLRPKPKRRKKQVKLPVNFQEVAKFPMDEPLIITKADSPFSIIYVSPCLEEMWNKGRQQLLDIPLQKFCATSRDYARANHAAFCVVHTCGACQDSELAFDLGGSRGPVCYKTSTGPFYMANDLSEINRPEYLVWHLVSEVLTFSEMRSGN